MKKNYDNIYNIKPNKIYTEKEIARICEMDELPESYKNITYWNSKDSGVGKRLKDIKLKAVFVNEINIKFIDM